MEDPRNTIPILECTYPRMAKPLGCTGFIGIVLGEQDNIFKLLLTFRSDQPGGRVMELQVVIDRYLEFKVYKLIYLNGCYTLCTLKNQILFFSVLGKVIPVDKYLVGKGERAWLIYDYEEYRTLALDDIWDDDIIASKCPYVDPSYVIGLRNYLIIHNELKSKLLEKISFVQVKLKCSEG